MSNCDKIDLGDKSMARSKYWTQLPLDEYCLAMRIKLENFNQLNLANAPTAEGCGKVWDQTDRDELAFHMQQAEKMICRYLKFSIRPEYVTNERIKLLRNARTDWWNASFTTSRKYVEGYGTEQLTLLIGDAPVTYSDDDGDPRGTLELATMGDNLYDMLPDCETCNYRVFFRQADGARDNGDRTWEIRPLEIDKDGDLVIIKARSAQFVKPELWKLTKEVCVKSDNESAWIYQFDTDNLVDYVSIYCETLDTDDQVTMYWKKTCASCDSDTEDLCAYGTDDDAGIFEVNFESSSVCYPARQPDYINVNYKAGYPLDDCLIEPNLKAAVIHLTNALLSQTPCECAETTDMYKEDRDPIDPLTTEAANMPWDVYRIGALKAWRIVKQYSLLA
jgi:hypothetical protein